MKILAEGIYIFISLHVLIIIIYIYFLLILLLSGPQFIVGANGYPNSPTA